MNDSDDLKVTRREFLITGATSVAAVTLPTAAAGQILTAESPAHAKVAFEVNGPVRVLDVDTRTTLLDALRENLKLTGTRKGCDDGDCGVLRVALMGAWMAACMAIAL